MRLDAHLAGQWTPAELGVHPVAGGGPLPACEAIRTLLDRDPASHVDLSDPQAIAWLVAELQLARDVQAIRTLATRVADRGGPGHLAFLAEWLEHFRAGGDEALRILLPGDRVGRAALGPPGDMAWLLEHLVAAGAGDLARALLTPAPPWRCAPPDPPAAGSGPAR